MRKTSLILIFASTSMEYLANQTLADQFNNDRSLAMVIKALLRYNKPKCENSRNKTSHELLLFNRRNIPNLIFYAKIVKILKEFQETKRI